MRAEGLKDQVVLVTGASSGIGRATLRREREVIYGEVPAAVVRLTRFLPGLTDWGTHRAFRKVPPAARTILP